MKPAPWQRFALLSATILAVAPVKCNSIFAKPAAGNDDGYEYVTVSGSQIPQRVRKGQMPDTTSPVDVVGAEALRDALQRNQSAGRLPGAGK